MPIRVSLPTALFLFLLLGVFAQSWAPAADPRAEEIAKAVNQLGADDYLARERATAWLWAAGPSVEDALKAGLKSSDAEIVARCRDLLDKIPYGITPDMPRRFVELIETARSGGAGAWPAVAPQLLDLGPRGLTVARTLVDRIANNDSQRDAMRRTLELEGWRVAPALLATAQIDQAGDLLERSAVVAAATPAKDLLPVRHYAAFVAARKQLPEQLARWRALAEKNGSAASTDNGRTFDGTPDRRVCCVIVSYLALLHGDLAEARRAADQTNRADLKEKIMFEQGAWADLAALPASNREAAISTGLKTMYLAAAGRSTEAKSALDDLKGMPLVRLSEIIPPLVFRALMYSGHPDDALAALGRYHSIDGILPQFEVLCQKRRYAEAFAMMNKSVGEHTAIRWQWDTAKLRVYQELGERDKFRQILEALTAYDSITPAEATPALDTIELLVALNRTEDALPIAAAQLNGGAEPPDVFGKLFPKFPLATLTWWRYERLQNPSEPMRATLAILPAHLDGRLAEPEGRAILEAAAKVARTQPDDSAGRWLQGLAEACQSAGMNEQARVFAKEAAERTNSAAAWLRLGDLNVEAKQYAEAASAYQHSWQADSKSALPLWLRGWALEKAGQTGGREARDLAHMLPLGNDDTRFKFSEELANRFTFGPEVGNAARDERLLVARLSNTASSFGRNAEGRLSGDRRAPVDRLELANHTQRFLFRMLQSSAYFFRHQFYLDVLYRLASQRAQELVAKGDLAGAMREAETAEALLPGQVESAAVLVPELTKHGHAVDADKLYLTTATVLDRLCQDYPNSAVFRNNRAWLAARSRRDLDPAVDLARKAVEMEPRHANYRETLAEVLFQRGDQAAALAEIKRCIEQAPKDTYFAKQQKRFEAGDKDAALPER